MYYWSVTSYEMLYAFADSFFKVFSAPKYCDSTENKGAYINIGPDYKLEFHKFDAVPHPNIRPMVSIPGKIRQDKYAMY